MSAVTLSKLMPGLKWNHQGYIRCRYIHTEPDCITSAMIPRYLILLIIHMDFQI